METNSEMFVLLSQERLQQNFEGEGQSSIMQVDLVGLWWPALLLSESKRHQDISALKEN